MKPRSRTLKTLSKSEYARSARLATSYANEHTVYSSNEWQAIWALIFEAYKTGYRTSIKEKS